MNSIDERQIVHALCTVRDAMQLVYDDDVGVDAVAERAAATRRAHRGALRRRILVIGVAFTSLASAGVTSATVLSHNDVVGRFFWNTPEKAPSGGLISRTPTEAPHVLAASIGLPGGRHAAVYLSSDDAGVSIRCVLVQQSNADGSPDTAIGECGDGPRRTSAVVWAMNGVLVGTVPDPAISKVRIELNGWSEDLAVVDQYFAFAPRGSESAADVSGVGSVVGYLRSGERSQAWTFTLPYEAN